MKLPTTSSVGVGYLECSWFLERDFAVEFSNEFLETLRTTSWVPSISFIFRRRQTSLSPWPISHTKTFYMVRGKISIFDFQYPRLCVCISQRPRARHHLWIEGVKGRCCPHQSLCHGGLILSREMLLQGQDNTVGGDGGQDHVLKRCKGRKS